MGMGGERAPGPGGSMVEHQTSNLRVVGSSPTSDVFLFSEQYGSYKYVISM